MQKMPLEKRATCAYLMGRFTPNLEQDHTSSNCSFNDSQTTDTNSYTDSCARYNPPPTPPMNSSFPHQSGIVSEVKQESEMLSSALGTGALSSTTAFQTNWQYDNTIMDEPLGFSQSTYGFDGYGNFHQTTKMLDHIGVNNTEMPGWNVTNTLQSSSFIYR